MSKNKEKKYVSDNAQLMSEWNWERNIDDLPSRLTLGNHKKFGGNVKKDTNGKRKYPTELSDVVVLIARAKKF